MIWGKYLKPLRNETWWFFFHKIADYQTASKCYILSVKKMFSDFQNLDVVHIYCLTSSTSCLTVNWLEAPPNDTHIDVVHGHWLTWKREKNILWTEYRKVADAFEIRFTADKLFTTLKFYLMHSDNKVSFIKPTSLSYFSLMAKSNIMVCIQVHCIWFIPTWHQQPIPCI